VFTGLWLQDSERITQNYSAVGWSKDVKVSDISSVTFDPPFPSLPNTIRNCSQ